MIVNLKKKYSILEQQLSDILTYCDSISEDQLHQQSENKWSAVEILHHLSTSEIGTVTYLRNKMKGASDSIPKAGISSFLRSRILMVALNFHSKKFKAPKILGEMPKDLDYEKTKIRLKNNREIMAKLLGEFDKEKAEKAYFKHPIAGRINIYQTLDFLNAHFERHAAQIHARTTA